MRVGLWRHELDDIYKRPDMQSTAVHNIKRKQGGGQYFIFICFTGFWTYATNYDYYLTHMMKVCRNGNQHREEYLKRNEYIEMPFSQ